MAENRAWPPSCGNASETWPFTPNRLPARSPYSTDERDPSLYSCDSVGLAERVREWCHAAPPEYRIALCGYVGEGHESLERDGWSVFAWSATGGAAAVANAHRERIWFSPACQSARQTALFSA